MIPLITKAELVTESYLYIIPHLTFAIFLSGQNLAIAQSTKSNSETRTIHELSPRLAIRQEHWVIALDEVAWTEPGGAYRFERIPDQPSLSALRSWVTHTTPESEVSPMLVVYQDSEFEKAASRAIATRDVVVALSQETSPESIAIALNATYNGELSYAPGKHRFETSNAVDALTAADALVNYSGVLEVHPQIARWREFTSVPDDPFYPEQWQLKNLGQTGSESRLDLNVEQAWETVSGRGVIIGIVDSGLMANHPDLASIVVTDMGYDFRDGDSDHFPFLGTPNQQDPKNDHGEDSHGTLVEGVAAGRGFNGIGFTGVAPEADIADIRLIGDYITDLQEADAISHRNDVIAIKNNSWGLRDNGASLSGPDSLSQASLWNKSAFRQ